MKGNIIPPVSPLTLASLPLTATQVDGRPGTEPLSPASHSNDGSFLKKGNYFKHIIVLESMQFWHPLHTTIKVSLSCLLSVREDNFSLLSLLLMHTQKQGGRRLVLFCLQVGRVRKPDPEKVQK